MCDLIELLDEGTPVVAPEDLVYSTQPKKATGMDGHSYFVKGPDRNIIVAEAVAHQLARSLGINVPEFGIAIPQGGGGPLFASREVARCLRQVESSIVRGKVTNRGSLALTTCFDIWVMNKDRNIGNLVGESQLDGMVTIVSIDFEKSMSLRGPYPLTTTPTILPKALWPSGTLGELLRGTARPDEFCGAIERITNDRVLDAFRRVESRLNEDIPWKESSARLLENRARNIRALVEEVWR
jgi:HipA-like protein